jgi:two-component system, LytTR family, sensor kinase
MLYLISFLIDPYAQFWKSYFSRPLQSILIELCCSLFFCVLISESSIFINNRFNQYISWIEKPIQRLTLQTIATLISTLTIISTQFLLGILLSDRTDWGFGQEEITGIAQWIIVSVFIALMISSINTVNYLITNWKKSFVEAAELKQAAAEAELHALKLQLDPHFVFNNLSVLSELILEDQQLGYAYAENFSKVYRYLLVNAKTNLISLEDELKFVKAYIFLIENRVGAGVSFKIDIEEKYLTGTIPLLTMQILIENALKHNKTLKSDPLKINIYVNKHKELVISNTVSPLERKPISSGIGLNNIIKRYKLLTDKNIEINVNDHQYTVNIPLA